MNTNLLPADILAFENGLSSLTNELQGAHIFITGGTGFFGKWLLESIVFLNNRFSLQIKATVLTRNPRAFLEQMPHLANIKELSFVRGDVMDFSLPVSPYTHFIHAATEASAKLAADNPLLMIDTVVTGTRRTLDFAVDCGAKTFLLTSSGGIYGTQPPEISHISENCLHGPDTTLTPYCYHEGKRMAEMLCCAYAKKHNLEAKIARCFAFAGPHLPLNSHFAIGNFIDDALKGKPIKISGDGTPLRSYMYAADLVVWLWTILLKGRTGRPYNVGSDIPISIENLAHKISLVVPEIMGSQISTPLQVQIAQQAQPGNLPTRYVPNVDRAKTELGLSLSVGLDESIARTAKWWAQFLAAQ